MRVIFLVVDRKSVSGNCKHSKLGHEATQPDNLVEVLEQAARRAGFSLQRNKPYAGGFITEHYGKPLQGVHAIQIEINRALYMDERAIQRSADFAAVKGNLTRMLSDLASYAREACGPRQAAAE